jgi:hypothetical protein
MENGIIQDCQISASSYLDTNRPEEARLNVGSGWKPFLRGTPFCDKEYLQVGWLQMMYFISIHYKNVCQSSN